MSVQALTWAFKQKITPAGLKFVLVALANYASEDEYCYPSQKKLAELTGQSVRAVNAHLLTLETSGYIKRVQRFRDDGGRTSDGFYLQTARAESAFPPMQDLHAPPADGTYAPLQNLHTPYAESASNTKEETKDHTKEDTGLPPVSLRSTSPTGERAYEIQTPVAISDGMIRAREASERQRSKLRAGRIEQRAR